MLIMNASNAIKSFIKSKEGLRLLAYLCQAGVWTIGYGHTFGVKENELITPDQAETYLQFDVKVVETQLRRLFPQTPFTQPQFDALISLGFNLAGGLLRLPWSAPHLYQAILNGDYTLAAKEFLDMDHALNPKTGQMEELSGLKQRRLEESQIFLGISNYAGQRT